MNRGSELESNARLGKDDASMRPRFMNRGSAAPTWKVGLEWQLQ